MPDNNYKHPVPPNSFSRELDSRVQAEEMPYGYTTEPPAADTGDFDQKRLESKKQYKPKGR
jgi:hypothetical protein